MRLLKWKGLAAMALAVSVLGVGTSLVRGPAGAAGPAAKKADKRSDGDKIQGTWKVVSFEVEGKKQDDAKADQIKKARWEIKRGEIIVKGRGDDRVSTYKLFPDRKPKAIDVTPQTGGPPEQGKVFRGVYALEGDTLKLCLPTPGNTERPKEVATRAGSGTMMIVLRRVPAGKK
jgi:uncharacterized protein (TIGR03067 family)